MVRRTLLEEAIEYFGYHPIRTPKETLEKALLERQRCEMQLRCAIAAVNDLDDDAIYEVEPTDHILMIRQRIIQSQNERKIILAPFDEGENEPCLDRQALDNDEVVSNSSHWYSSQFAFGWSIRTKLERQVRSAMAAYRHAASEVRQVRTAIENDEVVLTPERLGDLEFFRSLNEAGEELEEAEVAVDWLREGF